MHVPELLAVAPRGSFLLLLALGRPGAGVAGMYRPVGPRVHARSSRQLERGSVHGTHQPSTSVTIYALSVRDATDALARAFWVVCRCLQR